MNLRKRNIFIALMLILLVSLSTVTSFAAETTMLSVTGDDNEATAVTISNVVGPITDIVTNGFTYNPNSFTFALKGRAYVVNNSATFTLVASKPIYCTLAVQEITPAAGGGYDNVGEEYILPFSNPTGTKSALGDIQYSPGSSASISKEGIYMVTYTKIDGDHGAGQMGVVQVVKNATTTATTVTTEKVTAKPTSSKVTVDGKEVAFDAYNINGSNYFKLRDIAYVLDNSGSEFEVFYDETMKAINLTLDCNYTPVGGELAKGDGKVKTGVLNAAPIYVAGLQADLSAYNIGGNNYFKLRDLGDKLGFSVEWNAEANTIEITSGGNN